MWIQWISLTALQSMLIMPDSVHGAGTLKAVRELDGCLRTCEWWCLENVMWAHHLWLVSSHHCMQSIKMCYWGGLCNGWSQSFWSYTCNNQLWAVICLRRSFSITTGSFIRSWERFCNMFSESSPDCWAVLRRPCWPSEQVELSEQKLQNLSDDLMNNPVFPSGLWGPSVLLTDARDERWELLRRKAGKVSGGGRTEW